VIDLFVYVRTVYEVKRFQAGRDSLPLLFQLSTGLAVIRMIVSYLTVLSSAEAVDSRRIDFRRQTSRESSLQLPSEPRRSVLSWPTDAMPEGPDQDIESYPSALVPY